MGILEAIEGPEAASSGADADLRSRPMWPKLRRPISTASSRRTMTPSLKVASVWFAMHWRVCPRRSSKELGRWGSRAPNEQPGVRRRWSCRSPPNRRFGPGQYSRARPILVVRDEGRPSISPKENRGLAAILPRSSSCGSAAGRRDDRKDSPRPRQRGEREACRRSRVPTVPRPPRPAGDRPGSEGYLPSPFSRRLSLHKDAPLGRAVQRYGTIVATPVLSGLHHRYVRI